MKEFSKIKRGNASSFLKTSTFFLANLFLSCCTWVTSGSATNATFASGYRVGNPNVDLCFSAAQDAQEILGTIKDVADKQYNLRTNVHIEMSDSCDVAPSSAVHVDVHSTGEGPKGRGHLGRTTLFSSAIGARIDLWTAGCRPVKNAYSPSFYGLTQEEKDAYEACEAKTILHELGHVFGLADEEFNPGSGANCGYEINGDNRNTALTEYDPTSVMSYCARLEPEKSKVFLSDKDISALAQLYPSKQTLPGSQNTDAPMASTGSTTSLPNAGDPMLPKQGDGQTGTQQTTSTQTDQGHVPPQTQPAPGSQQATQPTTSTSQMSPVETAPAQNPPSKGTAQTTETPPVVQPITTATSGESSLPTVIHEVPVNIGVRLPSKHTETTYFKIKPNSSALKLEKSEYCPINVGSSIVVDGVSGSIEAKHMRVRLVEAIPGCSFGTQGRVGYIYWPHFH